MLLLYLLIIAGGVALVIAFPWILLIGPAIGLIAFLKVWWHTHHERRGEGQSFSNRAAEETASTKRTRPPNLTHDVLDDWYEVLEVRSDASAPVIRAAYKILAQRYHPDRVPEDEKADATARMQLVTQAYKVLGDEKERARYDAQRRKWQAEDDAELAEELSRLRREAARQRAEREQRTAEIQAQMAVAQEAMRKGVDTLRTQGPRAMHAFGRAMRSALQIAIGVAVVAYFAVQIVISKNSDTSPPPAATISRSLPTAPPTEQSAQTAPSTYPKRVDEFAPRQTTPPWPYSARIDQSVPRYQVPSEAELRLMDERIQREGRIAEERMRREMQQRCAQYRAAGDRVMMDLCNTL